MPACRADAHDTHCSWNLAQHLRCNCITPPSGATICLMLCLAANSLHRDSQKLLKRHEEGTGDNMLSRQARHAGCQAILVHVWNQAPRARTLTQQQQGTSNIRQTDQAAPAARMRGHTRSGQARQHEQQRVAVGVQESSAQAVSLLPGQAPLDGTEQAQQPQHRDSILLAEHELLWQAGLRAWHPICQCASVLTTPERSQSSRGRTLAGPGSCAALGQGKQCTGCMKA